MICNDYDTVNVDCPVHGKGTESIREQALAEFEARIEQMPDGSKDRVIAVCACGEHHQYTARSILIAMKDPFNEEGQRYLHSLMKLRKENMKPIRPENLLEISDKLEKILQAKYSDIYVGSGYGLYNYPGPGEGWFLRIQTNDDSIRNELPTEFEGYPVTVSVIARAY